MEAMTAEIASGAWAEHPVVKWVVDRAEPPSNARDLLCAVHDVMTGLEDRFPGLESYGQIFPRGSEPLSAGRARRVCAELGLDEATLTAAFGATGPAAGSLRFEGYERLSALASSDRTYRDIKAERGESEATIVSYIRKPPTELDRESAERVIIEGESIRQVARSFNCGPTVITKRCLRVLFHDEVLRELAGL